MKKSKLLLGVLGLSCLFSGAVSAKGINASTENNSQVLHGFTAPNFDDTMKSQKRRIFNSYGEAINFIRSHYNVRNGGTEGIRTRGRKTIKAIIRPIGPRKGETVTRFAVVTSTYIY